MLSKLLAASLLALQSAAFLVVPETKSPAHANAGSCHNWAVQLQCHECPFPTVSEGSKVILDDAKDSWLVSTVVAPYAVWKQAD